MSNPPPVLRHAPVPEFVLPQVHALVRLDSQDPPAKPVPRVSLDLHANLVPVDVVHAIRVFRAQAGVCHLLSPTHLQLVTASTDNAERMDSVHAILAGSKLLMERIAPHVRLGSSSLLPEIVKVFYFCPPLANMKDEAILIPISVCQIGCSSCTDISAVCTTCQNGFTADANDKTKCDPLPSTIPGTTAGTTQPCPDGSFSTGQQCAVCSPSCGTCSGPSSNNCTGCPIGQFLFGGNCVGVSANGVCQGTNGMIADNNKKECDSALTLKFSDLL